MEQEKQTRIKVNKEVAKETVILNLTLPYLGVFALFFFLGLFLLVADFSFNKLVIIGVIEILLFLLLQFLDTTNFLERFKKSKIPDEFYNDLY